MSKSIKAVALLGFIVVVAACAQEQEEVVIVEPISEEPVHTGKFK